MSLKQKSIFSEVLTILGILIMLLVYIDFPFWFIGLAVALAGIFLHSRWHRCPYYGRWLGRSGIPKFCPNCGKAIDPDERAP